MFKCKNNLGNLNFRAKNRDFVQNKNLKKSKIVEFWQFLAQNSKSYRKSMYKKSEKIINFWPKNQINIFFTFWKLNFWTQFVIF